jgi:hypothetical protein
MLPMEPSTAAAFAALLPFAMMLLVLLARSVRQINQLSATVARQGG